MRDEEINKFIHEKVMGECWFEPKLCASDTLCNKCGVLKHLHDKTNYVGDISAAMKAVEKMRENGWLFKLESFQPVSIGYWAEFQKDDYNIGGQSFIEGDSAPKAIVLAIISALQNGD